MKLHYYQYFSHYILPRIIAYTGKFLLKILSLTCKFKLKGFEQFENQAKNGNSILMLWHNNLMMVAPIFQKRTPHINYTAFISQSRDGEALALFTNSYKNGHTIRVRHHAKQGALKEMIDRLKNSSEVLIITPDGPKGPVHKMKPGLAMAALETNAKVFPFSWESSDFWELKTWDKMRIPKPFSTITATIGPPILLPKESSLEKNVLFLEKSLLENNH